MTDPKDKNDNKPLMHTIAAHKQLQSKTFYQTLGQGLINTGLITTAFTVFNLTDYALGKNWPTNWEDFVSLDNVFTVVGANLGGALAFNLFPAWELIKKSVKCCPDGIFSAALPYLKEVTTSVIGFIPYTLIIGATNVALSQSELGPYEQITKLALVTFGSLTTTAAIGKMKSFLDLQDLVPLFIALVITAYSGDLTKVSEAIADPSNPIVKDIFLSISNAAIAALLGSPYPALEFGAKKAVSWFGSFFCAKTSNTLTARSHLINEDESNRLYYSMPNVVV